MFIRVSPKEFKLAILDLMQSSTLTLLNFKVIGNYLHIQNTSLIIDEKIVTVIEKDCECDMSINLDKTVLLLNKKDDIKLEVSDDVLVIKQNNLSIQCVKVPEQRVVNEAFKYKYTEAFSTESYCRFINSARSIEGIAKSLSVTIPNIQFHDGIGYVSLSNTIYISETKMPDMSLSYEVCKRLKSLLDRAGDVKYVFDVERYNMFFRVGGNEAVSVAGKVFDYLNVDKIKDELSKLKEVCTVNLLKEKGILDVICKVYKKVIVDLSFFKSDIGLSITNGSTNFTSGEFEKEFPIFTIRLSLAQVQAILKLFGDYTDVIVMKGVNTICLTLKNSKTKLLLAGTVY